MTPSPTTPRYQLRPPALATAPPTLDDHQQAVVDHPDGPLLVLAGPGTGKTTTLVEAIADRIERGASPESVLALTFSRKAAEQLRDRVTARLGRTLSGNICSTFHSFAYGLIRAYAPPELYVGPLRLLSGPEQDVILRELLSDRPESVRWPDSLRHALGTRGFAREVHDVLSRARERGVDGPGLVRLGEQYDLPAYVAAGHFLQQYLDVLDSQAGLDYADLIVRAVVEAERHREELRARYAHVFVDEYQDTDPSQVALLAHLAGDGRNLTVVGDPHQSIYAFRGADVRGILDFPRAFRRADGAPADVVALARTRRFGPRLLVATQRIARRLPVPAVDEAARAAFLEPTAEPGEHGEGRVEVVTFDSDRGEAEHLADLLRRAHLEDGVPWDEMAVLVRSGRSQLPALRRALGAAGVPVEVAGDDVPLVQDPAVRPLLDALRAALNLANHDPDDVDHVDAGRAEALLTGPLGGLDAGEVRRLARALRDRERVDASQPRPSRELVRLAVLQDDFLAGIAGPEAARARALHELLAQAGRELAEGHSAEEVLWTLWSGADWPARLRAAAESGGPASRRAHRDLDSIVALFDAAARAEELRDHAGARNFVAGLAAQEIPAQTLAEKGVRGAAVRLLTAHRSKGLEWRLVVVAHVQDGSWPDLRRRSSLLQADRIAQGELAEPVTAAALLREERRLFYVACTRARERLVVTAVASPDPDGDQPSRFLGELGVEVVVRTGRPSRPLSLAGLVAELRRTVADPAASAALRAAAARRLASLAAERVGARALVPAADPANWWGTRARSRSGVPVRDIEAPVPISASVLTAVAQCPTAWFLEREAGGVAASHQAANLGQLVHALAERVALAEVPADLDTLMGLVEDVWHRLQFRTPWSSGRERARIRLALGRFLEWHAADSRRLLATEHPFATELTLPSGEQVSLRGYADRIELDADGRVVVVDLKTGRSAPSGPAVQRDLQLGLYQLAVDHGAVDDLVRGATGAERAVSGGAELVQLGDLDPAVPALTQAQAAPDHDGPVRAELTGHLERAARYLRGERFPAVPGDHCKQCPFVPICPSRGAGSVVTQ